MSFLAHKVTTAPFYLFWRNAADSLHRTSQKFWSLLLRGLLHGLSRIMHCETQNDVVYCCFVQFNSISMSERSDLSDLIPFEKSSGSDFFASIAASSSHVFSLSRSDVLSLGILSQAYVVIPTRAMIAPKTVRKVGSLSKNRTPPRRIQIVFIWPSKIWASGEESPRTHVDDTLAKVPQTDEMAIAKQCLPEICWLAAETSSKATALITVIAPIHSMQLSSNCSGESLTSECWITWVVKPFWKTARNTAAKATPKPGMVRSPLSKPEIVHRAIPKAAVHSSIAWKQVGFFP